jgi:hypothetical protein
MAARTDLDGKALKDPDFYLDNIYNTHNNFLYILIAP